jgi:hypothetical protein
MRGYRMIPDINVYALYVDIVLTAYFARGENYHQYLTGLFIYDSSPVTIYGKGLLSHTQVILEELRVMKSVMKSVMESYLM